MPSRAEAVEPRFDRPRPSRYHRSVAWIRTIPPEEASGLLKRLYDEAVARAGKVFNVVRIQSLRPEVLEAGMALYRELMRSPRSPLSRAQREMIAVAVSRANDCHY
jgi:alkylhydroperoxidase family enzyme